MLFEEKELDWFLLGQFGEEIVANQAVQTLHVWKVRKQYLPDMSTIAGNVAFWEKRTSGGSWIMSYMASTVIRNATLQRAQLLALRWKSSFGWESNSMSLLFHSNRLIYVEKS
jgi:hypothetical protein